MTSWNYYIDASTTRMGITLESLENGQVLVTDLDFKKYKPNKNLSKAEGHVEKMRYIKKKLDDFVMKYPPNEIYLEGIFIKREFLNSSEVTLKLHGFLILYFIDHPIHYFPPKSVRKALLSNGNASKKDLQEYLYNQTGIVFNNFDQSDSYALYEYKKKYVVLNEDRLYNEDARREGGDNT